MSRLSETIQKYPKFEKDIKLIADADPSGKQKYLAWAAKQLSNKVSVEKLIETIKQFHEKSARLTKKDINAYKNVSELQRALRPAKDSNAKQRELAKKFAPVVYEDKKNGIVVRRIDSADAMKFYGAGTKWCITNKETFYESEYRDPYIIFVGNKKFCMVSGTWDLYNEHDDCLDYAEIRDLGLEKICKSIESLSGFAKEFSVWYKFLSNKLKFTSQDLDSFKLLYKEFFNGYVCSDYDYFRILKLAELDLEFYNKIIETTFNICDEYDYCHQAIKLSKLNKKNLKSYFKNFGFKIDDLKKNCHLFTDKEIFELVSSEQFNQYDAFNFIKWKKNSIPNDLLIPLLRYLDADGINYVLDNKLLSLEEIPEKTFSSIISRLVEGFNKSQLNKVLEIYKCSKKNKKK